MRYFVNLAKWAWYEKDPAKKWARTTMLFLLFIDFLALLTFIGLAVNTGK